MLHEGILMMLLAACVLRAIDAMTTQNLTDLGQHAGCVVQTVYVGHT
jgi:hypothetical protein